MPNNSDEPFTLVDSSQPDDDLEPPFVIVV